MVILSRIEFVRSTIKHVPKIDGYPNDGKDVSPSMDESGNNSGERYREFLVGIANAIERRSTWRKEEFNEKYRAFFPPKDVTPVDKQKLAYEEVRRRWKAPKLEVPIEQPDDEYGYHSAILRHQLRVVWKFADSGDLERAQDKCKQLHTDTHRYLRDTADDAANEPWRLRLVASVALLGELKNLKICENPGCEEPFFIRHGRQLYCSIPCSAEAKAERYAARNVEKPKNENMSRSAKERWRRERARKK